MSRRRLAASAVAVSLLLAAAAPVRGDGLSFPHADGLRDFRTRGDQPPRQFGAVEIAFVLDLASAANVSCVAEAGAFDDPSGNPGEGPAAPLDDVRVKLKWEAAAMACPLADEVVSCSGPKRLAAGKATLTTPLIAPLGVPLAKVERKLPQGCCPYFFASAKPKSSTAIGQLSLRCGASPF
jgi:hypothetical protein